MELHDEVVDEVIKRRSRLDMEHELEEWLSLEHFPDETRVNLTLPGRRFVFQHSKIQETLGPVVSRAQWSRYRSNPEMTIPLSTLRMLVENNRELFMTSFTVTTIGNKKVQFPIKLPIKTRNNSLAKLLALFTLSKNVFQTGTFQTDQKEKVLNLIETFDAVFDVNLCPDGDIAQNQRGYYVKIPMQICSAIVKAFTGDYQASFPLLILSVSKCKDEQDILDFITMWLKFTRLYRFDETREDLFMFRYNDETREIVKLLDKLGVKYEPASIVERGSLVPVYRVPNTPDNKVILNTPSLVSRLKNKISSQEARIKELKSIKDRLEEGLRAATDDSIEKLSWSRGMDERLAADLSEKLIEFERILIVTRNENEDLKRMLRESGTSEEWIPHSDEPIDASDITQLREEVDQLKERLSNLKQPYASSGKEVSYSVTKKITMKEGASQIGLDIDLRNLVKTFLASPSNWILFLLGTSQPLSKEQISRILGIPSEKRMDLQKQLNEFLDQHIIKVIESGDEELYQLDRWSWSDQIGSYTNTILGNKEDVPLDIRQLVRYVLK
ncbi:MAG: hypothetical protein ACXACP_11965 [Candidatus Hodarchaeales archaeon]